MTTSAIYLLPTGCQTKQRVCFYIARDGYPEGSANYFYKMHHSDSIRRNYAECFLRANPDAEFAKDEEEHEDVEFRYAINQEDVLSVWKKAVLGKQWDLIYQGLWYQFVNKYWAASEHLHLFKLSKNLQDETLMTISQAKKWAKVFKNSVNRHEVLRESFDAFQAQIEAILAQQSLCGNVLNSKPGLQAKDCHFNMNNSFESIQTENKILSFVIKSQFSLAVRQIWEERFAIFALELEEKIAEWAKHNQAEYCAGYHNRVAALKKFIRGFHEFFNQLVDTWTRSSGVLETEADFDLSKAVNQLRHRMIEKHGFNLKEAIRTAMAEYGYWGDDDEEDVYAD